MAADTPTSVASLEVSALLNDYRARAASLTPAELAHAVTLMRKARTGAATARTARKTAAKAAAPKSADDLFADLDSFTAKKG